MFNCFCFIQVLKRNCISSTNISLFKLEFNWKNLSKKFTSNVFDKTTVSNRRITIFKFRCLRKNLVKKSFFLSELQPTLWLNFRIQFYWFTNNFCSDDRRRLYGNSTGSTKCKTRRRNKRLRYDMSVHLLTIVRHRRRKQQSFHKPVCDETIQLLGTQR